MDNKFVRIAQKETTLSELMEGRTKISMDDVIAKYPDGVTITEFDFINGTNKKGEAVMFPVLAFAENEKECFFGGAVINKICLAWVADNGGDVDGTSGELKAAGGVKMKFRKTTTKGGNNLVAVDVIG